MIRNLFLILFLAIFCSNTYSQNVQRVIISNSKIQFSTIDEGYSGLKAISNISHIDVESLETKNGSFISITSEGLVGIFKEGEPDIPVVTRLIEVPFGASVTTRVIGYEEIIIDLTEIGYTYKIKPAQPSVSKSDDINKLPFYLNEKTYETDGFTNQETAFFEESGVMRSMRLGRLEIRPIQYNPVTNTLRILNNLEIDVVFENADIDKTAEMSRKYGSPLFNNNANTINRLTTEKSVVWNVPITYVIVSDPMFQAQLQEFVEWKEQKGFHVIEAYTNNPEVGTTTTSIKSYLQNLYNNPEDGVNPPTFVLLVGDVAQIPAWSGSGHVTDLYYFEYTGDKIPEVFYGRFSAQNTSQLQPQIDKTLLYEKYLMDDPSYLGTSMLVAGVDGTWASTAGNGAINYATSYYWNAEAGVDILTYLYNDAANSTVMSSSNSGASASIYGYMNQGVGYANYTAHCGSNGWSDPSFTSTNVGNLTNAGKYGLWIGNCCQSLKFEIDACFGESGLRKANGGAIGVIGGSNNTYWYEDYYWAIGVMSGDMIANPTYEMTGLGVYDAIHHTKVNEVNNPERWYIAQGQLNIVGNLAVQSSTSTRKAYYWEIYHLMGDPSLIPYLKEPSVLNVELPVPVIMLGNDEFLVNTDAPFAYIALNQNDQRIAVAMADINGNANLNISGDALIPGEAEIVITAQNKQPYIATIIVTSPEGAYVILDGYDINDESENNNGKADYRESFTVNVTLKNVGVDLAQNISATLTGNDDYFTVNTETPVAFDDIGFEDPNNTITLNNAFSITLSDNVPDQHQATFALVISDGTDEWTSNFKITANAPKLSIGGVVIDDQGQGIPGILDSGETADAIISITNTGNATSPGINALLSTTSPYLQINGEVEQVLPPLTAGSTTHVVYSLTASAETPSGTSALLNIYLTADNYLAQKENEIVIGLIPEFIMGQETSVTACIGRFYDSGGISGNYGHNENYSITFNPNTPSEKVRIYFTAFDVEPKSGGCWDVLKVYDGPSNSSPLIGEFCGATVPAILQDLVSTHESGSLTFNFVSDGSVAKSGWEAEFECYNPSLTTYTVIFEVSTTNNDPLVDATVSLSGYGTQITNTSGEAIFEEVVAGTDISFTVTHEDFHTYNSVINVNSNENVPVILIPLSTQNIFTEELNAFPNPFSNSLMVNGTEFVKKIIITNVFGQEVALIEHSNANEIVIPTQSFTNGVYFIRFYSLTGDTKVIKMIKH